MRPTGASASRPASGGVFTTAARLRDETLDACPSASPDVGPRGVPDSPAEVATRATSGFTSASALLRAARASSPRDPPATRATLAPVPPPASPRVPRRPLPPLRPVVRRRESRLARREGGEARRRERKKRARQTSPPGSIVAAMAAAADATRDPNSPRPSPTPSLTKSSNASSRWSRGVPPRRESRVPRVARRRRRCDVHPIREDGPRRARRTRAAKSRGRHLDERTRRHHTVRSDRVPGWRVLARVVVVFSVPRAAPDCRVRARGRGCGIARATAVVRAWERIVS